ncbi:MULTISPECIES: tellurite resistance TerB family protein [Pirellulaceae]|nr:MULTISPECIES: TerB family tellurite resistance protein [Pirellulaceae]
MAFPMFTDFFKSVRENSAATFSRIKDRTAFNRVVWACFLVGRADGDFDANERKATAALIHEKLPQYSLDDILEVIAKAEAKIDFDPNLGAMEIIDEVGKARGDAAEAIIRAAVYIGGADGDFDDTEKGIVRQLCSRMDINPANYGL